MATNFHIWKHFMVCMSGQPRIGKQDLSRRLEPPICKKALRVWQQFQNFLTSDFAENCSQNVIARPLVPTSDNSHSLEENRNGVNCDSSQEQVKKKEIGICDVMTSILIPVFSAVSLLVYFIMSS